MTQEELKKLYGVPSNNEGTPSADKSYDDALATALRDQNYKAYFNTAIQQYNMKNNMNKYLNNELANQGLHSQGYGSSAHAGINNQAINLYSQNLANYQKEEQDITQGAYERTEEKAIEKDNQLVQFIANANEYGNTDAINKYMQNYGYMNEDGTYTDAWNNLDETRKAYIQSAIDEGKIESSSNQDYQTVLNYDDDAKLTAYDKKGNIINSSHWNEEYKAFSNDITLGNVSADTYIKFRNNREETMYLYYSDDGKIYYVNKETWEARVNAGATSKEYKTLSLAELKNMAKNQQDNKKVIYKTINDPTKAYSNAPTETTTLTPNITNNRFTKTQK